jgi:hypothetical protein
VGATLALMPVGQDGAVRFWVLLGLAGIGLPWVALQGSTRLRSWIASFLATDSAEAFGMRSAVAALIIIQTAIWPAYLMLMAWATDHYRRTAGTRSGVVLAGHRAMERRGAMGLVSGAGAVTPPGLDAALLASQC